MERRRRWERRGRTGDGGFKSRRPRGGSADSHGRGEGRRDDDGRRREGGDLKPYRDRLTELASRLADRRGLVLVDLELAAVGRRSVLRVLVDRAGGVTVGECSDLSRDLSSELDQVDFIPFGYQLEVSSPGVGRPFRRSEQWRWSLGKRIKVSLREPLGEARSLEGTLVEVREGTFLVRPEGGHDLEVPFENVREACRVVEF